MPTHVVLGRSAGLTDEQMEHLADDPLPGGLFTERQALIVEYSHRTTRLLPIDDELYRRLEAQFSPDAMMEMCFVVGASNLVNRYHLTFHTDVDDETGGLVGGACQVPLPDQPPRG